MDGTRLPRDIITGLRCDYPGEEVFRVDFFPAIAANPFLGFTFRATLTGAVNLVCTDMSGTESRESRLILVT